MPLEWKGKSFKQTRNVLSQFEPPTTTCNVFKDLQIQNKIGIKEDNS